jgi:hypothetical protein
MFARFRTLSCRLQVSIVETRRVDGQVRQEHIAGLGAARLPLSPETRLQFWEKLYPRLARLANRLDGEAQAKILGAISARIPMVTRDERRTLQLEVARDDAKFWEMMPDADAELKRRVQALYEIAVGLLGEEEARDVFCSVTKRGRGKRGPGRNPQSRPTREAERKRLARTPKYKWKVIRSLTAGDYRDLNQYYIDAMNDIAAKK